MTRTPHDQFAKNFLKAIVEGCGEAKVGYEVAAEVREVDFYFIPFPEMVAALGELGVLGRMLSQRCAIEAFRNPMPAEELNHSLTKRVDLQSEVARQRKREQQPLTAGDRPHLWMLTPNASKQVIQSLQLREKAGWPKGIYFISEPQRTGVVVLNQLPVEPETLWLRMLGRGEVQREAIAEFMGLPKENPFKVASMRHLTMLQLHLRLRQNLRKYEEELVMNTTAVYEQWRQDTLSEGEKIGERRGRQEGRQEGRREEGAALVLRQLKRRFGEISSPQTAQVERLTVEQLENLGEALLDFRDGSELERWLLDNPVQGEVDPE